MLSDRHSLCCSLSTMIYLSLLAMSEHSGVENVAYAHDFTSIM